MESNISRDHIALEAMKIHLNKSMIIKRTVFNRIACALGFANPHFTVCFNTAKVAEFAYCLADAMIAEREKKDEEQKEQEE